MNKQQLRNEIEYWRDRRRYCTNRIGALEKRLRIMCAESKARKNSNQTEVQELRKEIEVLKGIIVSLLKRYPLDSGTLHRRTKNA